MPSYDEYMTQIAQRRQEVGQRIAGMPQFQTSLSEAVYGKEKGLPSMREQMSGKIAALYDTDKRLAESYSRPGTDMYIEDPYQRRKVISAQHKQELQEIQSLQNMIANRQDVLGSAIDKGLEIYKAGVDAQKFEYEGLMDELGMKLKIDAARRAVASRVKKGTPLSELDRQLRTYITEGTVVPEGREVYTDADTGEQYYRHEMFTDINPEIYNVMTREEDIEAGDVFRSTYFGFPTATEALEEQAATTKAQATISQGEAQAALEDFSGWLAGQPTEGQWAEDIVAANLANNPDLALYGDEMVDIAIRHGFPSREL